MAVPLIQTAFNSGEISPELYGEIDLKKIGSAATTARNFIVSYRGGLISRGGFAFVGRCKQNPPNPPRAITFQFSITQGYELEFGTGYIRFVFQGGYVLEAPVPITGATKAAPAVISLAGTPFSNGDWVFASGLGGMTQLNNQTFIVQGAVGGSLQLFDLSGNPVDSTLFTTYTSGGTLSRIYTISSPYDAVDLPYLKFSQSADVMSLTLSNPTNSHEYPPYDLVRHAATNWVLTQTDFDPVIAAPTSVAASANAQAPTTGVNATFAYVVTAVDGKGNESIASMPPATCHGADIEVEGGTNTITWAFVSGAKFYNVYRAPPAVDTGTGSSAKANPVPGGSIFGFVGSSYGTQFLDTQSVADLVQTPPTHQNPFAPGQILAVTVTGGGAGQTSLTYTITTSAGINFSGTPILIGGSLGGFLIGNPGENFAPGDSIAFNGAGFASGSVAFGSTNPSALDTVTLNGIVWTFVTAITGPQQTLIGGSLGATLAQLASDLSASSNGSLTVASYSVDVTNSDLLIAYKTAGAAGNTYTLAASRATPSGATLTGGSGSGSAGAAATGSLTFGGGNPTNSQTIVLDGVTWTFVTGASVGNQTTIQGTLAGTLTQLASDLTASGNANIGLANYSATATVLNVTYKTVGTVGNSYTLGGGTTGATASASTLTGGTNASATPTATLVVGPTSGTFPGVNNYFQQRHFFANSLNNPDTFWASQTGLFQNFDTSIPTIATDAITGSPWTEQVNGIQWLIPMPGGLIAMTGNRAWQIIGEGSYQLNVQPVTPSTTQAQPQAFNGCSATIPPIVIDYDVVYVEAIGNNIVRDLSWNFWVNIYTGADLTILSSHLFLYRQIVQWTWARLPYKVLWAACDDGTMLALTYLKEQEVYGWTRCDTDGIVVSIASVTEPPVNAVYAIVQRFPPVTASLPGSFIMEARENYDPANVALISAGHTPPVSYSDQQAIGTMYDQVRRSIMYPVQIASATSLNNTSGFTLWSGEHTIAPGASYDATLNHSLFVAQKNIDTNVVTFFNTFDSTKTVPSGIGTGRIATLGAITGGSLYTNGTYSQVLLSTTGAGINITANITVSGHAVTVVTIVSPGTGSSVSDALTVSAAQVGGTGSGFSVPVASISGGSDGTWRRYVQDLSNAGSNVPVLVNPRNGDFWMHANSCEIYLFRRQDNFAQVISPFFPTANGDATGLPVGLSANYLFDWETFGGTSILHILPSSITAAEVTADKLLSVFDYNYPAGLNSAYFKHAVAVFDSNLYLFASQKSGPKGFKLWKVVPASGFSDVTPWTTSTGPNLDCASYTTNGSGDWDGNVPYAKNLIFNLPPSQIYCISKLLPADAGHVFTAFQFFRADCTYVDLSTGVFDYHEGFVTGYVDANFQPTTLANAVYWVGAMHEMDNYLDMHDYLFSADYTKRWFVYMTQQPASPDNDYYAVFVQYKFQFGQAPLVLQVINELTGWDANAAYAGYATAINKTAIVQESTPSPNQPDVSYTTYLTDPGIYDPVSNAFWLSGATVNFFQFNSTFSPRSNVNFTPTPPFLRLSFSASQNLGAYIMERMDNRLWQTVEDAYAVDSGVSNPIASPAANLLASSFAGAVTFTADQAVFSLASVGQVLRMGGGIATISAFTDNMHIDGTWMLAPTASQLNQPFAASGRWTLASPVTTLRLPHLAGEGGLVGLADGVPIGGLAATPTGPSTTGPGVVTLPFPASDVKVGLPFAAQMQTPYLNGPQVAQGARKITNAATVRLAASGNFQVGTNQPDGGAQNPQVIAPPWTNMTSVDVSVATGGQTPVTKYTTPGGATATPLWTGDRRVAGIGAGWVSKGQIAVQQTLPLPLEITAIEPEALPGDLPEAGVAERGGGGGAPAAQPSGSQPPTGFLANRGIRI